jgi:hypothetical protein
LVFKLCRVGIARVLPQYIDLNWHFQAGAWERELKGFGGTGILPVHCTGWKPVPPITKAYREGDPLIREVPDRGKVLY